MRGLVAVTGATGFLGRVIVRTLIQQGWRVRILSRCYPAHEQFSDLTFEAVPGDLSDAAALCALVRGADVVVHAAGLIKARNTGQFHAVNVQGTENIIRSLNACATSARLVLVSSMAAREPHLSPYAATKRAAEERVRALLCATHDFVIVRPCAVYGPWDVETLTLFRALDRRFTILPQPDGARICLAHVQDVADAIAALCAGGGGGSLFEISDEQVQGYGWDEIRRHAALALGVRAYAARLPGWVMQIGGAAGSLAAKLNLATPMLTIDKVREIQHPDWASHAGRQPPTALWRPKIGINRGFSETVGWYRNRGWLCAIDTV